MANFICLWKQDIIASNVKQTQLNVKLRILTKQKIIFGNALSAASADQNVKNISSNSSQSEIGVWFLQRV